jgi:P-type E1-E2 ATPase
MAQAILLKAKNERINEADVIWSKQPIEVTGAGIEAVAADGTQWFLGRPLIATLSTNDDEAMSSIELRRDGVSMLVCFVHETVRPEAAALLKSLMRDNIEIWLASGDHSQAVMRCAQAVGVQSAHCRAQCLPDDKAQLIKELQEQGMRVVFVGDGINDAPAMAAADLSIAVQGANRIAQTSASIVMTRGNLSQLSLLLKSVLGCRERMQQNLWWAVLYNLAAVPAAMLGWISPIMAASAMMISSISVTLNSTRRTK